MPADRLTPTERVLRAKLAAYESWVQTKDRSARTAKARQALEDKFLAEADGDPVRAESIRRAYYARLAFLSAKKRSRKNAVRTRLEELDGGANGAA